MTLYIDETHILFKYIQYRKFLVAIKRGVKSMLDALMQVPMHSMVDTVQVPLQAAPDPTGIVGIIIDLVSALLGSAPV